MNPSMNDESTESFSDEKQEQEQQQSPAVQKTSYLLSPALYHLLIPSDKKRAVTSSEP